MGPEVLSDHPVEQRAADGELWTSSTLRDAMFYGTATRVYRLTT
jgi:hypothetical protein